MATPSPESQPAEAAPTREQQRSTFAALGWGLACAACAGVVWVSGFLLVDYRLPLSNVERAVELQIPRTIAFAGAIGGLLGGLLVAFPYPVANKTPRVFILGGIGIGAIGGALALPAVVLCGGWLNPLVSSTLFWCLVGFLAGLIAHRLSATASDRDEQGRTSAGEEANPNKWALVRALPLLLVVGFLLHICLLIATTRY